MPPPVSSVVSRETWLLGEPRRLDRRLNVDGERGASMSTSGFGLPGALGLSV